MKYFRKYIAPVFMWNPNRWTLEQRIAFAKVNSLINSILPSWLLRRLDARNGAKEYWRNYYSMEKKRKARLKREAEYAARKVELEKILPWIKKDPDPYEQILRDAENKMKENKIVGY